MAQGLKSLAGGNVHAALHRLSRCREALLQAAAKRHSLPASQLAGATVSAASAAAAHAAHQPSLQASLQEAAAAAAEPEGSLQDPADDSSAELDPVAVTAACQMATVCGTIGDCYQRLGDPVQAEQLYYESMAAVESYAESDAEAAHALSVSLNKLGDMRYSQQQLEAAKQLYRRALQLRQLACGPLTGGRAGPGQQLELASSLIKVADVCRVSKNKELYITLLLRGDKQVFLSCGRVWYSRLRVLCCGL
jgi:tetratricopeptide (TPR) repeat protein